MRLLPILLIVVIVTKTAAGLGTTGLSSGTSTSLPNSTQNAFAAWMNPAALALNNATIIAWSLNAQASVLNSLSAIQSEQNPGIGNYDFPDDQQAYWQAGLTQPFRSSLISDDQKWAWGLTVSGPWNKARQLSSGPNTLFIPIRQRACDNQFRSTLGLGVELVPDSLSIGVALSAHLHTAGNARASLTPNRPNAEVAVDVGWTSALTLGGVYQRGPHQLGFSYHQAAAPKFIQDITGSIEVGGATTINQPMTLSSTLYYEPHRVSLDYRYHFANSFYLLTGISWETWGGYEPPSLRVVTKNADGSTITSEVPVFETENTLNPLIGISYQPQAPFNAHLAYQFKPTPLVDQGNTNLLDASTHIFAVDVGYQLSDPIRLSASGQIQWVPTRHFSRPTGQVGSPGYDYAAIAYSYGLQLEAEL